MSAVAFNVLMAGVNCWLRFILLNAGLGIVFVSPLASASPGAPLLSSLEMSPDTEERYHDLNQWSVTTLGRSDSSPILWHAVTMCKPKPQAEISVADALVWCC